MSRHVQLGDRRWHNSEFLYFGWVWFGHPFAEAIYGGPLLRYPLLGALNAW